MTELIFHIGGGKTGSSSIQATLSANRELLQSSGITYWGLMLEEAPIKRFEWQRAGGTMSYYNTPGSTGQLYEVISESLLLAESQGYSKAVWSNEWFLGSAYEFERNKPTLGVIEKLVGNGHKVALVAYVREHLSWALSAFMQWGIKHKTYQGDIMTFHEYTRKRPPLFYGPLQSWKEASNGQLRLYNYHTPSSVSEHFVAKVCRLPIEEVKFIVDNKAPKKAENYLRAVFNQLFGNGEVLRPNEFDRSLKPFLVSQDTPNLISWYNSLMPDNRDFESLGNITRQDKEDVNALLRECGEYPLDSEEPEPIHLNINEDELSRIASTTSRALINLAVKNQELKRRISFLESKLKQTH